jgi:hypothetical protein
VERRGAEVEPIALISARQRNPWSSASDDVLHPMVCRGRSLSSDCYCREIGLIERKRCLGNVSAWLREWVHQPISASLCSATAVGDDSRTCLAARRAKARSR